MKKYLKEVQEKIDYKFNNERVLEQAFIRKSYSEEHGGANNEVLEFIGDKSLDFVMIQELVSRFGAINETNHQFVTEFNEGDFTNFKANLVDKEALSDFMDDLGFHKYLIMGKGDIKENVSESKSVKEDLFEAIVGAVTVDSNWDVKSIKRAMNNMMQCPDFEELLTRENYVGLVQEYFQKTLKVEPTYTYEIDEDGLYECKVIYPNHKVLGDIEALGYSSSKSGARKNAAHNLYDLFLKYGLIVTDYEKAIGCPCKTNAISQVNELRQKGLITNVEFSFDSLGEGEDKVWTASCKFDQIFDIYYVEGKKKQDAKNLACYYALCELMHYEDELSEYFIDKIANDPDDIPF